MAMHVAAAVACRCCPVYTHVSSRFRIGPTYIYENFITIKIHVFWQFGLPYANHVMRSTKQVIA